MLIKAANEEPQETGLLKRFRAKKPRYFFRSLAVFMLCVLGLGFFALPYVVLHEPSRFQFSHWSPKSYEEGDRLAILSDLGRIAHNAFSAALFPPEIEVLYLDVKMKHMRKIWQMREEALEDYRQGRPISHDKYVPAYIRHGTDLVRVKIRLKGDVTDHFENPRKMSFRVKVRDGKSLFSLSKFSLQGPHTRGGDSEAVYFEHLRNYDVLSPELRFVDLIVNGDHWGIMAIEGHFTKELLENRHRKESVILKWDETPFWLYPDDTQLISYKFSRPLAFEEKRIDKSEKLAKDYRYAVGLLKGFQQGTLKASDVFDVQRLAYYIAVNDVWASNHAEHWRNVRFAFNPYTARLEPIGFDRTEGAVQGDQEFINRVSLPRVKWLSDALTDPVMYQAYREAMDQVLDDLLKGDLLQHLSRYQDRFARQIHLDSPHKFRMPLSLIKRRAELLRQGEIPFRVPDKTCKLTYAKQDYSLDERLFAEMEVAAGNQLTARFTTRGAGTVYLNRVWVKDGEGKTALLKGGLKLAAHNSGPCSRATWSSVALPKVEDLALPTFQQAALPEEKPKVLGRHYFGQFSDEAGNTVVKELSPTFPALTQAFPAADGVVPLETLPFVKVEPGRVIIPAGQWQMDHPTVLRTGQDLVVEAGAQIRFAPAAALVVYGNVSVAGTPEKPVVFQGLTEAPESAWRGFVVLGQGQEQTAVSLKHFQVENTRFPEIGDWGLTGAVTVYRAKVTMSGVSFRKTLAEDGLNLVDSTFAMDQVFFEDIRSDAFDCDFCKGELSGAVFSDVRGDGLDISGSQVFVKNSVFNRIKDKAVSVGEESALKGQSLFVVNSSVAIAAKDHSSATVSGITLKDIQHFGFAAYMKKSMYGKGGDLDISHVRWDQKGTLAVASGATSHVKIDGETVEPVEVDFEALYKEGFMKK